jgi:hypothetical protein
MMVDVVEYICKNQNLKLEKQEISILIKQATPLLTENILKLAKMTKNINCITTTQESKFKNMENYIQEETGLILNVTQNQKKSTLRSNIILNLDFNQEELNHVTFPKNAIIVNFGDNLKLKQKNFNGINANFFNINLLLKYKALYEKLTHFNSSSLYESFIYKKTSPQNLWHEIAR